MINDWQNLRHTDSTPKQENVQDTYQTENDPPKTMGPITQLSRCERPGSTSISFCPRSGSTGHPSSHSTPVPEPGPQPLSAKKQKEPSPSSYHPRTCPQS